MGHMAAGSRAIGEGVIDHLKKVIGSLMVFFVFIMILTPSAQADLTGPRSSRPSLALIKNAVDQAPEKYRKDLLRALRRAGKNGWELIDALNEVSPSEREGAAFLIANMPGRDLVDLKREFLKENIRLAYQARAQTPWGKDIPREIFLNDVLPYASLNERRDRWRADFYQRFIAIARKSGNIDRAVVALNQYVFETLKVSYNPKLRPKPDQSPYESTRAHYASCTGLSILLTDALRSVGIPARIAGTAMWPDESGNHTWVEVWDGRWHYIGAAEPTSLDHTWFTSKAAQTDARHPIFAVSFKKSHRSFPMRWAPNLHFVPAVDVTPEYTHARR